MDLTLYIQKNPSFCNTCPFFEEAQFHIASPPSKSSNISAAFTQFNAIVEGVV
jgi:hypothetical protein